MIISIKCAQEIVLNISHLIFCIQFEIPMITVLHRDVIWFAKYLTCIILYSSNSYIIWHWFFSPCSWFHVFDCRNIQEHVFNFLTLDNCFFRFNCTIYLAKCFFINEIWNWFFLLVTESICWLYAFSFFYLIVYIILISIFTFAKKFFYLSCSTNVILALTLLRGKVGLTSIIRYHIISFWFYLEVS